MDFCYPATPKAFNVMFKPAGPDCNLKCTYCYYLEKKEIVTSPADPAEHGKILEKYIREYIIAQQVPLVYFIWQGGEPSLAGLPYFRKALELQQTYAGDKEIINVLQTNGTLLNEEWCRFLGENGFLTGISLDDPEHVHDRYRKYGDGRPSWKKTMHRLELLHRFRIEFNTLSTINHYSAEHPEEVYNFLKNSGSRYMQFIPVVERQVGSAKPIMLVHPLNKGDAELTPWSLKPGQLGNFLTRIFDRWVRNDVGKVFVQHFDTALANRAGAMPGLCTFSPRCGDATVLEHNGNLYCCDHFVYPDYYLGNILETPLPTLMSSVKLAAFGQNKLAALTRQCRECEVRYACHGDCPKHRFCRSRDGEPGHSYLCEDYSRFFRYITPHLDFMVRQIERQQPPAGIMEQMKANEGRENPADLQAPQN